MFMLALVITIIIGEGKAERYEEEGRTEGI
jgi:hypothetical protein